MEYKKYDIIKVNFFGNAGAEQGEERPAVIIQNNIGNRFSPTLIVLPLTSQFKNVNQATHTILKKDLANGLAVNSMVLGEQIKTIDKSRIIEKIGHVYNRETQKQVFRCFINTAALGDEDEKDFINREVS